MVRKYIYGLVAGIGLLIGAASAGNMIYEKLSKGDLTKKGQRIYCIGFSLGTLVTILGDYKISNLNKLKKELN